VFGWQKLAPEGFFMMKDNKYPIPDMGILNLVDKLLEVGKRDVKFGECSVTYQEGVKVGTGDAARECTLIEVVHPIPRQNFMFYKAQIFVDKELNIPIRYLSFDWPKEGEKEKLIEAYQYRDLKLNVGLTDKDFDHTNPAYQ
jgi:outer membrane lipoprotein-sorting protein